GRGLTSGQDEQGGNAGHRGDGEKARSHRSPRVCLATHTASVTRCEPLRSAYWFAGDGLWISRASAHELVEKGDCPHPAAAGILMASRRGTRSRRSPQRQPRFLRDISL